VKKLSKMQKIERDPKDGRGLGFSFDKPSRSGRVVLELEHADLQAGDKPLLKDAELWLERGEHIALVGPNGTGKTTLIDTLAGRRELQTGKLRTGHNVELGYLSQHAEELGSQGTVLEVTQRATGLTPGKVRALLGKFLFSGSEVEKPVAELSGGERRRVSLAILVQSNANLLILDEPTNHLDLESREALEDALKVFDGSLILVSHDRALLDAVGTRTIAIEERDLKSYMGGWADYARARDERKAAEQAAAKAPAGKNGGKRRQSQQPKPAVSKDRKRRMAAVETEIQSAEAALATLEDELADPSAWSTPERSADSAKRHDRAKKVVEQLYEELGTLEA
jgi:ATP-binding cassette subfamily F protein 3